MPRRRVALHNTLTTLTVALGFPSLSIREEGEDKRCMKLIGRCRLWEEPEFFGWPEVTPFATLVPSYVCCFRVYTLCPLS
ncbi:hypothetical protein ACS0TY_003292 [Phlomoides rotata]